MRHTVLIGSAAIVLLAASVASVAFAAVGHGAPRATLAAATARTAHVTSQHYTVDVRITKNKQPLTLHIHGATAKQTISVRLKMEDIKLPDGTVVPGPSGAELLEGPFLYERAPSNVAVLGSFRWLRVPVTSLSKASPALRALHDMTPAPLLRVLNEAHASSSSSHVFSGPVAYDDPIVQNALTSLCGGLEFRHLRIAAWVGRDGFVHRLTLTGRTADGSRTLSLHARFFAFDRPVSVTPPALGTFIDRAQPYLSE
jgi:hypothetical protein